jgi:hypothetical protein
MAALAAAGLTCVLAGCAGPSGVGAQSAPEPNAPAARPLDVPRDSEEAHLGMLPAQDAAPEDVTVATPARPAAPQHHAAAAPAHRANTAPGVAPAQGATTDGATHNTFTEVPARGPELVMARPGMTGLHPVRWQSATVLDPRTVRVNFTGGAAPCDVLDSVKVDYRPDAVDITLFAGSDPAQPDRMCAAVTRQQAVDVHLDSAVNGRRIEDGAASNGTGAPAPDSPAPAQPGPDDDATPVYAQHNTADAHPIAWDQAKLIAPQVVRIYYTSGVAPCAVLDHVRVRWSADAVQITLFQGHVPSDKPQMCPMIARRVYVDVKLDRPLDDRQITDGATT